MKTVKRRAEQFLFYDYAGIEAHLAGMAEKGWQLKKITPFYWEYRAAAPQRLAYAVTYFSEASEFNPYPTENQQTFHEYCQEAGWTLAAEWAQMQIFCARRETPTPIETDEAVKLKAIHRAMKKNFLPSSAALLVLCLFQLFMQLYTLAQHPVRWLSDSIAISVAACFVILSLFSLVSLAGYFVWLRRSRRAVEDGGICVGVGRYKGLNWALLAALLLLLAVFVPFAPRFGLLSLLGAVNVTVVLAAVLFVKGALKRAKASRSFNLTVTMVSCVALSLLMTVVLTWVTVRSLSSGWLDGSKPVDSYTTVQPNGGSHSWDVYRDDLPLRVEDLQAVDYEHYSYQWSEERSPLVGFYTGRQQSFPDGLHAPELYYEITQVKLPVLFDLCLEDALGRYDYREKFHMDAWRGFRRTDAPGWRADAVYRLYQGEEPMEEYVLCWGNRIVYIGFDQPPTPEQMEIVYCRLSGGEICG